MRRLLLVLLATCTLAFICGGPMTPSYPREERRFSFNEVPQDFSAMDLPWYGGRLVRSSDYTMVVSYTNERTTVEQLREWWPDAMAAEGWTERSRHLSGNGRLDILYALPDGRTAMMTIRPEGTLWWVILSIDR